MLFTVNGKQVDVTADADATLLWVLREPLKLTGTKYGCGMALCGACTVHVGGQAVRSCQMKLAQVQGKPMVSSSWSTSQA